MPILENVYCLGCKGRHEEVEIKEIKIIHVRGSPRTQAHGICPEGKKWTKLLKQSEIPPSFQNTEIEPPQVAPNEDIEEVVKDTLEPFNAGEVFQKANAGIEEDALGLNKEVVVDEVKVEEPVMRENVWENEGGAVASLENEVEEAEEEDAEEEVVIHKLNTRPVRLPREKRPRRVIEKPPPREYEMRTEEIDSQLDGKRFRAYTIGRLMGETAAENVGLEFGEYMEDNWMRTSVPSQFQDDFVEGYLNGGIEVIDSQATQEKEVSVEGKQGLRPTTVVGIAGLGIFGAWLASKLNLK